MVVCVIEGMNTFQTALPIIVPRSGGTSRTPSILGEAARPALLSLPRLRHDPDCARLLRRWFDSEWEVVDEWKSVIDTASGLVCCLVAERAELLGRDG